MNGKAAVRHAGLAMLLVMMAWAWGGCARRPAAAPSGFLSDYSRLEKVDAQRMWYASDRLGDYRAFIVDPVAFRAPPEKLTEEQRAEVGAYFRTRFIELLEERGLSVAEGPAQGVARVSFAVTDIARSTWWMKLHPGMRLSGAGTGGAAMEAEIMDSLTGEQLLASVVSASGQQLDFTAFSTAADVKNAVDKWAAQAARRLDEARAGTNGQPAKGP